EFARALGVSPQGKTHFENEQWVIVWAIGHLLTPKDPHEYDGKWKRWKLESLPIVPPKFELKPVPKTVSQLRAVKSQLSRSDLERIIVATDAGREGELIGRSLLNYSLPKTKK